MNKKAILTAMLVLGVMIAWAADGALLFPYLTPGSKSYAAVLWDWDSLNWYPSIFTADEFYLYGTAKCVTFANYGT